MKPVIFCCHVRCNPSIHLEVPNQRPNDKLFNSPLHPPSNLHSNLENLSFLGFPKKTGVFVEPVFYTRCFEQRSRSKSLYARTVVGWNMLCLEVPSETKTPGISWDALYNEGTCVLLSLSVELSRCLYGTWYHLHNSNDYSCNWSFSQRYYIDTLKNIVYTFPYFFGWA